jgi:hypothetical protein
MGSDQSGRGFWEWAYFGHQNIGRCFFVAHLTPDKLTDNFSYMGSGPEGIGSPDGMVVFGLGRDGATPLMRGANKFFIGFLEYGRSEEELPGMMKRHLSLLGL